MTALDVERPRSQAEHYLIDDAPAFLAACELARRIAVVRYADTPAQCAARLADHQR